MRSVVINYNEICHDGPGLFFNHNELFGYRQRVGERFDLTKKRYSPVPTTELPRARELMDKNEL